MLDCARVIGLVHSIAAVVAFCYRIGHSSGKSCGRLALPVLQGKGGNAVCECHIPILAGDICFIQRYRKGELLIIVASGAAYRLGYDQGSHLRSDIAIGNRKPKTDIGALIAGIVSFRRELLDAYPKARLWVVNDCTCFVMEGDSAVFIDVEDERFF